MPLSRPYPYIVSYDLKQPAGQYQPLFDELKRSPHWWHYLNSTWIVLRYEGLAELGPKLRLLIYQSDRLLILPAKGPFRWLASQGSLGVDSEASSQRMVMLEDRDATLRFSERPGECGEVTVRSTPRHRSQSPLSAASAEQGQGGIASLHPAADRASLHPINDSAGAFARVHHTGPAARSRPSFWIVVGIRGSLTTGKADQIGHTSASAGTHPPSAAGFPEILTECRGFRL